MFKKADLEDPKLLLLFQRLFDDTKASIVTRDRAARGAGDMPRGYRVQKVVSVTQLKGPRLRSYDILYKKTTVYSI